MKFNLTWTQKKTVEIDAVDRALKILNDHRYEVDPVGDSNRAATMPFGLHNFGFGATS